MVFYVFLTIFSKIIFVDFIFFYIEMVENYNCSFSHKTLWIVIVFLYISLFSFSFSFSFFNDFFFI